MNAKRRSEDQPDTEASTEGAEVEDPTPSRIVGHYREEVRRGRIGRSRTGVGIAVRPDVEAYHERRGWGEPSDEQVTEYVNQILS